MKDKEARRDIAHIRVDMAEKAYSGYVAGEVDEVRREIKESESKLREDFDRVIKQVMEAAGLEGITIPATPAQQAKWVVIKKRGKK